MTLLLPQQCLLLMHFVSAVTTSPLGTSPMAIPCGRAGLHPHRPNLATGDRGRVTFEYVGGRCKLGVLGLWVFERANHAPATTVGAAEVLLTLQALRIDATPSSALGPFLGRVRRAA